jgi:indolepyruvate ferredoxin oxidoreductase
MGGEGANWIGEAPFSTRPHVFQNLGDGTYNHSGVQAIRAALAAGVNITYKILYNDAVAMTGGQHNDGGLKAPQIVRELKAMGVKHVAVVYDAKEEPDPNAFPARDDMHERAELPVMQRKFREIPGVSAIVYIQTCAAEKRRRRKRGTFPDPDRRVFINTDVCEGCGDCGVQSNCVSIVPVETELGPQARHRPVLLQQGLLLREGVLPFVRDGRRARRSARPRPRRSISASCPNPTCPRSWARTTSSSPAWAAPAS